MISSPVILMRYWILGGPIWPPSSACPGPPARARTPSAVTASILMPAPSRTTRSSHGRSEAETVARQHPRAPLAVEDHRPHACHLPEPGLRPPHPSAPGLHQLRPVQGPSGHRRLSLLS